MTTNTLAAALALPDEDLLIGIDRLVANERDATVELVAHIAALELRPSLYAAQGYGTLFAYCTRALRLSEDAACNRIDAARVCRRFPAVLDLLASGAISLSTIRLLKPHLTAENQEAVFARATYLKKKEVEALVAELAPRPDVAASVRKLPLPRTSEGLMPGSSIPSLPGGSNDGSLLGGSEMPGTSIGASMAECAPALSTPDTTPGSVLTPQSAVVSTPTLAASRPASPMEWVRNDRPIVQPLAPRRYRVQFTIGEEAYEDLRRVQALLRREIPSGDVGAIFEEALRLLREKVEKAKIGAGRSRWRRPSKAAIRPGTDRSAAGVVKDAPPVANVPETPAPTNGGLRHRESASRHIPTEVKRAVWWRDAGQCAFVSAGLRCSERNFLELHHIHPFALDGPPTVGNISLRCRRHNQYEAELIFGPRVAGGDPMK
jgi:hypothetical protein